jgi:hypothetical protein
MTLFSHNVALYLWCAQPVLQLTIAVVFWRRKLHKQFPVFFAFLVTQVVNFSVIFPLWLTGNYDIYFIPFWVGEAINAILGFKVIHEIFIDVFRPYHTLKDLGTLLFKWAGVVMLLVSVVVAFSNSFDQSPLVHALSTLQRSVRIVQFGLILFLLLFSRFLGVSRKQVSFGISLGFGLFAGVELLLYALNSGGFVHLNQMNKINSLTYFASMLTWLAYSLSRKEVREPGLNRLQTERWAQGLSDLQHNEASDSLIPMFEGMVERAFSRSSNLEPTTDRFPPPNTTGLPRVNSAAVGSKTRP